jgi:ADP-L-glycero-D-manno-heptose 6-epimerase
MIVVTGGAGMIGSNIVAMLNAQGYNDICVVDDLSDGKKFTNLVGSRISDYIDKDDFLASLSSDLSPNIEAVFHQGACSSTTEWDGRFMMRENFAYSKTLLAACQSAKIPLIYASSASVYGKNIQFAEQEENELPLNVYGYSKKLFDDYVRRILPTRTAPIVGLRYFNVYGPREQHKGTMASVAHHMFNQVSRGETLKLFGAYDGVLGGQQFRDFVHVQDVASVNLWAWRAGISGVFNCGTGRAQSFQNVAESVIAAVGQGKVEYIDFPDHLKGRYQSFTQADLSKLRNAGYEGEFRDVQAGVLPYIEWLQQNG